MIFAKVPRLLAGLPRRHDRLFAELRSWRLHSLGRVDDLDRAGCLALLADTRSRFEEIMIAHLVVAFVSSGLAEKVTDALKALGRADLEVPSYPESAPTKMMSPTISGRSHTNRSPLPSSGAAMAIVAATKADFPECPGGRIRFRSWRVCPIIGQSRLMIPVPLGYAAHGRPRHETRRCQRYSPRRTDHGGLLSHGPIVARELGIPCVFGTDNGTGRIRDGQLVKIYGDNGTVEVLSNQMVSKP